MSDGADPRPRPTAPTSRNDASLSTQQQITGGQRQLEASESGGIGSPSRDRRVKERESAATSRGREMRTLRNIDTDTRGGSRDESSGSSRSGALRSRGRGGEEEAEDFLTEGMKSSASSSPSQPTILKPSTAQSSSASPASASRTRTRSGHQVEVTVVTRPTSAPPAATTGPSVNPLVSSIKFIDDYLRLQTDQVQRFMSEQPGCFIVGVLGKRGVGKSWVMNTLASAPGNAFNVSTSSSDRGKTGQTTAGIDLHITQERIVLLDTQAIITARQRGRGGVEATAISEQIALLMFSICHVILVVSDVMKDEDLWAFLRKAETAKYQQKTGAGEAPGSERGGQRDDVYFPEIIFVCNKAKAEDFSPESHARFQQYEKLTPGGANEEPNLWILPGDSAKLSYSQARLLPPSAEADPFGVHYPRTRNFLAMEPDEFRATLDTDRLLPARGPILCKLLRNAVFETPRYTWIPPPLPNLVHLTLSSMDLKRGIDANEPMVTPRVVAATQAVNAARSGAVKKWFQVSEKEWFKSAVRIWEALRAAPTISDVPVAGGIGGSFGRDRT
ncbi:hypothetical protein BC829DRAFT_410362 [Chytridium lagenaria]|nr:hypothetical protein BC829DRAFT_410362 [Chytridium lagenaria]